MSKNNNSKGFVYVLRTPSEEGWVYINARKPINLQLMG